MKHIVFIGILSVLLIPQGCALFADGDIACETTEACPEGMICGADKICVDPSVSADAAVGVDSVASRMTFQDNNLLGHCTNLYAEEGVSW